MTLKLRCFFANNPIYLKLISITFRGILCKSKINGMELFSFLVIIYFIISLREKTFIKETFMSSKIREMLKLTFTNDFFFLAKSLVDVSFWKTASGKTMKSATCFFSTFLSLLWFTNSSTRFPHIEFPRHICVQWKTFRKRIDFLKNTEKSIKGIILHREFAKTCKLSKVFFPKDFFR